jgi:hypothetical protein
MLNVSYLYISTSQSICALYVTVLCSYMMHLPRMLLSYFLNEFKINASAPIITGITFVLFIIIIIIDTIIFILYHYAGYLNYIFEANHVYRAYIVAAVLYLQFVLHVILFRP